MLCDKNRSLQDRSYPTKIQLLDRDTGKSKNTDPTIYLLRHQPPLEYRYYKPLSPANDGYELQYKQQQDKEYRVIYRLKEMIRNRLMSMPALY